MLLGACMFLGVFVEVCCFGFVWSVDGCVAWMPMVSSGGRGSALSRLEKGGLGTRVCVTCIFMQSKTNRFLLRCGSLCVRRSLQASM